MSRPYVDFRKSFMKLDTFPLFHLARLRPKPTTKSFPITAARHATQGSSGTNPASSSRKAVTVASDDGHVRWGELSKREKVARTTQQSFNFLTILTGLVMTGGVITFLYLEVFSSSSKTNQFNRAVDRVKSDGRCTELLGPSKKISAYGEPTWNKWAKARPIASSTSKDRTGTEHLVMHFNVEGPLNKGVVNLHMAKRPEESDLEYKYLTLDVKGHQRIYLENADEKASPKKKAMKMFGVRWG